MSQYKLVVRARHAPRTRCAQLRARWERGKRGQRRAARARSGAPPVPRNRGAPRGGKSAGEVATSGACAGRRLGAHCESQGLGGLGLSGVGRTDRCVCARCVVCSCSAQLLGETAVGKSSLALRFARDQFLEYQESTIGAAFLTQSVIVDGNTIKFEIWDTAGQERYHSLAPMVRAPRPARDERRALLAVLQARSRKFH
jgi:hypothetical protein